MPGLERLPATSRRPAGGRRVPVSQERPGGFRSASMAGRTGAKAGLAASCERPSRFGKWRVQADMEAKERRGAPSLARSTALMCVRQSMLKDLHRGLSPVTTTTGDYSDVVVIDADGECPPWPDVSRFDEDEMGDLMRQIVNKIYTFLVKMDDPVNKCR